MNIERFRWQTSIDRWLEIATARLCAEAAGRVRRDIMQHYQAAFDEERAAGKTARRSAQAAIAKLGDPFRASRAYRRVYLTERELSFLENENRPVHRKIIIYAAIIVVVWLHLPWLSAFAIPAAAIPVAEYCLWCGAGLLLAEVALTLIHKLLHQRVLWRADPVEAAPGLIAWGWIATLIGLVALAFMLGEFIAHPYAVMTVLAASASVMFVDALRTALRIRGKIHKFESL